MSEPPAHSLAEPSDVPSFQRSPLPRSTARRRVRPIERGTGAANAWKGRIEASAAIPDPARSIIPERPIPYSFVVAEGAPIFGAVRATGMNGALSHLRGIGGAGRHECPGRRLRIAGWVVPEHAVIRMSRSTAEKLERAKGFEPSTPTLARLCSTPELRPL
jgi:hypothetical protein